MLNIHSTIDLYHCLSLCLSLTITNKDYETFFFLNTSVNCGNIPDAQSPTARKGVQHTGSLCGHGDTDVKTV